MEPQPEAQRRPPQGWARFAGAGFELAGISFLFGLGGYALDRWLGNTKPLATAVATLIGFSLGLLRFIILASQENTRQREQSKLHSGGEQQPDDE